MFDSLTTKLQTAFRNLRGLGKISESNVADALREVRMALLEADVNFKVARDFIERVKTKALGAEVIASVQPGQQIIKFVSDELVALLGSQNAGLGPGGNPSCILMVGLHGSGKTTSSGKLARLLHKAGRARRCWWRRTFTGPAAMDQLETLGRQIGHAGLCAKRRDGCAENRPRGAGFREGRTTATRSFSTRPGGCRLTSRWCRNWCACATWSSRRKFCWCWTPRPARKRSMSPRILTRRSISPGPS